MEGGEIGVVTFDSQSAALAIRGLSVVERQEGIAAEFPAAAT